MLILNAGISHNSNDWLMWFVVTHFWVPTKNKNKKPKEIRKIIRGGSAQEESEKKLIEEVQKCKEWNFTVYIW
jgi:hypothetical protein